MPTGLGTGKKRARHQENGGACPLAPPPHIWTGRQAVRRSAAPRAVCPQPLPPCAAKEHGIGHNTRPCAARNRFSVNGSGSAANGKWQQATHQPHGSLQDRRRTAREAAVPASSRRTILHSMKNRSERGTTKMPGPGQTEPAAKNCGGGVTAATDQPCKRGNGSGATLSRFRKFVVKERR